jgi:alpha-L-fucosidase 2
MGGAWLATHLWQHYLFTGDRRFLADNYPALKGAAEFCADWLMDDGQGRLVTAAGGSPEIEVRILPTKTGASEAAGICMGPTMDLGIVRELFGATIRASELLDRDARIPRRAEK